MKILKKGKIKAASETFETACGNCGCRFRFKRKEALSREVAMLRATVAVVSLPNIKFKDVLQLSGPPRGYLQVRCPQEGCGNKINVRDSEL